MEVHDADRLVRLGDDQRGDLRGVDDLHRLAGELVRPHRLRRLGHHRRDVALEHVGNAEVAPQVAVGDDADQRTAAIDDADAAEGLGGHLVDRLRHARAERHERNLGAGVHEIAHQLEHGAELAARVEAAEIERREAAALEQRDCDRIAQRSLHQGRGGGREVVGAGLARLRQSEQHVRSASERALGRRRDGDEANPKAARIVDQVLELGGLARPRQGHDDVVGGDHAEIAVARLARMHEESRRARGSEGGCDLATDMAGFSHAGDDQPAARARDQVDRRDEGAAEPIVDRGGQRGDAAGLGLQGADRTVDQAARALVRRFLHALRARRASGSRFGHVIGWLSVAQTGERREPPVNRSLTISVLASLTKAGGQRERVRRPVGAAGYLRNVLISR